MITAQPTMSTDAHSSTVTIMTMSQVTTVDQIITGTQDHNKTGILLPLITNQPQLDTSAMVGGAITVVFIITAGVVILFLLYIILKNNHTTKPQRYIIGHAISLPILCLSTYILCINYYIHYQYQRTITTVTERK